MIPEVEHGTKLYCLQVNAREICKATVTCNRFFFLIYLFPPFIYFTSYLYYIIRFEDEDVVLKN